MAFNWQTFRTRSFTALLFVLVMLAGLCVSAWTFLILFSFIHFGCWAEFQRLLVKIDPEYKTINPFHKYGIRVAGWCLLLWFCTERCHISGFRLHEAGWWIGLIIVFMLPVMELLLTRNIRLKHIGFSAFGLVYISLSLGLLMDLYDLMLKRITVTFPAADLTLIIHHPLLRYGWIFPAVIIGTLWINDTMAYISGSLVGRTPLSSISPKKTWEGTMGGILLAVICTGYACNKIFPAIQETGIHFSIKPSFWYILAAVVAISGTVGDLLESKLKRMAGVKDSGKIMPGHGGFLDRFDSLLLAVPFGWLFIVLFL